MKDIGATLKSLREQNNMTRREVADKLIQYGFEISDKTIYGYESGRSSANADMFLALCKVYKCSNIFSVFGGTADDILFTNNEWEIIEKYRDLDDHGKEMVDFTLEKEYERSIEIQKQSNIITLKEPEPDYLAVNAAREEENSTAEDREADNAIMADDSEWE